jgi:phosphatidylinositol glycan class B
MNFTWFAILLRVYTSLSTRTFFQPDEFFQSLEVAHRIVFGYGKLTWEWQPTTAIRSTVYPALYVPIYWALQRTGLDDTFLLVSERENSGPGCN